MVSHPKGVGVDSPGIGDRTACGHEAGIGDEEIGDVVCLTLFVEYGSFGIVPETAAAGDEVLCRCVGDG